MIEKAYSEAIEKMDEEYHERTKNLGKNLNRQKWANVGDCEVEGCNRPAVSCRLCSMHYQRMKKKKRTN